MDISPQLIELLSQWPAALIGLAISYLILRWGIKPILELWIASRKQDNEIRANQIEAGEKHLSVLGDMMERQKEFFDDKAKSLEDQFSRKSKGLENQMAELSKIIKEKDKIIEQQLRIIEEKDKTIELQSKMIERLQKEDEKESK